MTGLEIFVRDFGTPLGVFLYLFLQGGMSIHRSKNGNSPATKGDIRRLHERLEKHYENDEALARDLIAETRVQTSQLGELVRRM